MKAKAWPNTLLIWFYDEHGGYFDHVPPPPAAEPDDVVPRSLLQRGGPTRSALQSLGLLARLRAVGSGSGRYDRYGFRVPAEVVSPFAKKGYVSSTTYDHTSVLKLIERNGTCPPSLNETRRRRHRSTWWTSTTLPSRLHPSCRRPRSPGRREARWLRTSSRPSQLATLKGASDGNRTRVLSLGS